MRKNCAIILAAGEGKRMKSTKAKVLQEVLFKPMVDWVIDTVKAMGIEDIYVVTGHQREQVEAHLGDGVQTVFQAERLGTGHAVMQASELLKEYAGGSCLVLCGDAPLFSTETIEAAGAYHNENGLSATVITAFTSEPTGYGRICRNKQGFIEAIVEERDADEKTKKINEINAGAYWFSVDDLVPSLSSLKNNNSQGEYYLTDVPKYLAAQGKNVGAYVAPFNEISGANDRYQLYKLNEDARLEILKKHMLGGVSIPCCDGVIIGPDVKIEADAEILPNTVIKGKCVIGGGSVIGPNTVICCSNIGKSCALPSCNICCSELEDDTVLSPFTVLK